MARKKGLKKAPFSDNFQFVNNWIIKLIMHCSAFTEWINKEN